MLKKKSPKDVNSPVKPKHGVGALILNTGNPSLSMIETRAPQPPMPQLVVLDPDGGGGGDVVVKGGKGGNFLSPNVSELSTRQRNPSGGYINAYLNAPSPGRQRRNSDFGGTQQQPDSVTLDVPKPKFDRQRRRSIGEEAIHTIQAAQAAIKSKLSIDFPSFPGRRSRRGSDAGPILIRDIKGEPTPPEVPKEEKFFKASVDGFATPPLRPRSKTMSNGHISRLQTERKHSGATGMQKVPTMFKLSAEYEKGAPERVYITGTMTQWECLLMGKPVGEKDYVRVIDCLPGEHVYKFNVDGHWIHDPTAETVSNLREDRKWNILTIEESDMDVYSALAFDTQYLRSHRKTLTDDDRSDLDEWTQTRPPPEMFDSAMRAKGPPVLPPQLHEVLLNKESIPESSDPVILPEPSRVVLEHFYAQSIRDNVLVLSTSIRYRDRYITEILYKPLLEQ